MKKILLLGGAYHQIPAIKKAKELGYYAITADYLPNNPGHQYSDEYHNVSTTDKEGILKLAKELQVDGVIAYASDPAAPVAAYVSNALNLPGSPLESIDILGKKYLWRQFLQENGFNTPKAVSGKHCYDFDLQGWEYPIIVKPSDSSGNKGITKISGEDELEDAIVCAQRFSRNKIVIVEEFIERIGCQIGGDGFYGDGHLDFVCFGDLFVNPGGNPLFPTGIMLPASLDERLKQGISNEIERLLTLLHVKNLSFNLEIMIDKRGRIFLMEIGPRNGGFFLPQLIEYYKSVSLVDYAVQSAMGAKVNHAAHRPSISDKCYGIYVIHSNKEGQLKGVECNFGEGIILLEKHLFLEPGDKVVPLNNSNDVIGIALLEFENQRIMKRFFHNIENFITPNIDGVLSVKNADDEKLAVRN